MYPRKENSGAGAGCILAILITVAFYWFDTLFYDASKALLRIEQIEQRLDRIEAAVVEETNAAGTDNPLELPQ